MAGRLFIFLWQVRHAILPTILGRGGEPVRGPEIRRLRIHGKLPDGPTGVACHCSSPSGANPEPAQFLKGRAAFDVLRWYCWARLWGAVELVSRSFFYGGSMGGGYYPEAAKARYDRLKGLKICVNCGQRDAVSGQVLCDLCRQNAKDTTRLIYWTRRADHFCTRCGTRIQQTGSVCAECAEQLRRQSQARRQRLIMSGLCVRCGKRPADGGRECALCRAKRNGA